ncbi:MAG: adenylosuccinate synthetase [Lutibacter sp.]
MLTSFFKFRNIVLFFFTGLIYGQRPTHSQNPQDNTPIDLNNLFDVIAFIVLPIVVIIFYFLWRKQVRKTNNKN